jgi:hypothetical protein
MPKPSRTDSAATTPAIHYLGTVDHETILGLLAACDVGVSLVDDPHTLKIIEYGAAGLLVVQLAGRAKARFGDRSICTPVEPAEVVRAIAAAVTRDGGPCRRTSSSSTGRRSPTPTRRRSGR